MHPLSGNQCPDVLTALMNMSLVVRLPRKMHLCRSSSNVPRLPSFLDMLQNLHVLLTFDRMHNSARLPRETTSERQKVLRTPSVFSLLTSKCASRHNGVHFFDISTSKGGPNLFWLRNVLCATTACTFSTSQLPKVVRTWCVLYILTSKRASRHNGVHFFDIATSKSGPKLVCFVHFDFEMCFAPKRRALFRRRNFQTWSEPGVFSTFWLGNVLRATTACNLSSLIWPAGSAPAALASLLFDPPELQIIGKTQCFATFLPFRAPGSSFFWDFLFFDLSSSLLFSDSCHLCFSFVHIVGSLTCKFPSPKTYIQNIHISLRKNVLLYSTNDTLNDIFGMVGFGMVGFGMRLLSWPICGC